MRLAPELAEHGQILFRQHGVAFLATIRKDGSPRLHPIVPIPAEGGLHVAVSNQSPKRFDLLRDGRYALHAMLGEKDEEFMLTGQVKRVSGGVERAAVVSAAHHTIHDTDLVFEFLIKRALWGYWENTGTPDTYPVHQAWVHGSKEEGTGA